MTVIRGLQPSYDHVENGMTLADMRACKQVADRLNEVIIFRSTGPWSKRWIEKGYPTKNFHVKGKSSDWGPQAGLVPYDGYFSKVGHNTAKADKGTKANKKGLGSGFAGRTALVMAIDQIKEAETRTEESPARAAVDSVQAIEDSRDLLLIATRPGDKAKITFVAKHRSSDGRYDIMTLGTSMRGASTSVVRDAVKKNAPLTPLEVMTSTEAHDGKPMPMTGDYDLFAVCPSWADYGIGAPTKIHKPGLVVKDPATKRERHHQGITFGRGTNMDKVLDPRLHTMGNARAHDRDEQDRLKIEPIWHEHPDMGNLTPRLLRCIMALNKAMKATGKEAWRRRIHHNAESHRHYSFGAITGDEMEEANEGFPLTVFQPKTLHADTGSKLKTAFYGEVCTLETFAEFKNYAAALQDVGFYVPKNWAWKMPSVWVGRKAAFKDPPVQMRRTG